MANAQGFAGGFLKAFAIARNRKRRNDLLEELKDVGFH